MRSSRTDMGDTLREARMRGYSPCTLRAICETALELLAGGERWVQGVRANDERGRECDPLSSAAARYSLDGALDRAASEMGRSRAAGLARVLVGKATGQEKVICQWQDQPGRQWEDVQRALQLAIVAALEEAEVLAEAHSRRNNPRRRELWDEQGGPL